MLVVKRLTARTGHVRDTGAIAGLGRPPEEGVATCSAFLPAESRGQSQEGCSPYGLKESDTTGASQHAWVLEVRTQT